MDFAVLLFVSVTSTSVQVMVMGGLHDNVVVAVNEPVACPLLTLKVPDASAPSLFAAFGWLEPPFMHSAVAVTLMLTVGSLPRPASLKLTVMLLVVTLVTDADTKCGLPAKAGAANPMAAAAETLSTANSRRMLNPK